MRKELLLVKVFKFQIVVVIKIVLLLRLPKFVSIIFLQHACLVCFLSADTVVFCDSLWRCI